MPSDTPVITGYYRYTDIWFEWHKALPNPEDGKPLRAMLAHDSLVHPEHPLRVEGVNGVQLYLGTFQTGEARLLFSSAQVDYIRYWLNAVKLTEGLIPLPYSDCLLTEANLRTVSPVVYSDGFALKNAIKGVEKNNKRLKGLTNPYPAHCRVLFEDVRARWNSKKGVWFALDFEAWELDHTLITEFGWSIIRWEDGNEINETGHLVVEERQKFTNTQYVKDYKAESRYRFHFGQQEIIKRVAFEARIKQIFDDLEQHSPIYLVFHNDSQDLKYLERVGLNLKDLAFLPLVEGSPHHGLIALDTGELIAALLGTEKGNQCGLTKMCRLLSIPTQDMHNAGNDACCTMLALKTMASGPPVDEQKEKRWPNQTPANDVKVQLKDWQEDSDYSDTEGIMGYAK